MTCHPLHFVCEHVCLYVSSAVFPWWVHNSSVLFLSHHVHLHVFFSVVYKPTVRRLCFQVMLFKWQKCPSQSAKAASFLSYLKWDHELISSNKVHPYEKTIERVSLCIFQCFQIIFCMFSIFPAVLSMILMVIIRYISRVLVWILTILVILGSLGKLLIPLFLVIRIEKVCFSLSSELLYFK